MSDSWVVDTNLPVVANGRDDGNRRVCRKCQRETIRFLQAVYDRRDRVLSDAAGEIEKEYWTYLIPDGQLGVGDQFFSYVLQTRGHPATVCCLPRGSDGEYMDLPKQLIAAGFDKDDRKFAALANRAGVPVATAIDSDWVHASDVLQQCGVTVKHVCGGDPDKWFVKVTPRLRR